MKEIVLLHRVDGLPEILKDETGKPMLFEPSQSGFYAEWPAWLAGEKAVKAKPLDYLTFEVWVWDTNPVESHKPEVT